MNFLILTQKYNFNPICFIMDDSNIKCRGSQAVRRLSRKQLRESVQGFESLSRRYLFSQISLISHTFFFSRILFVKDSFFSCSSHTNHFSSHPKPIS